MKKVFIFSGVILSITLFPGFLYGQGHADYGTSDLWLLKLDSLGDTLWSKTYFEEQCVEGLVIEELNDGGFIIAGLREASYGEFGKVLLLKTDSLGDTVWTRIYGNYFIGWKFHLKKSDDGGYWIVGKRGLQEKLNWKEEKIWVLKVDSIGDSIWMKSFGHKKYYEPNDIVKTNDGDYIIVGSVGRNPLAIGCKMQRLWLLKIDGRGNILWEHTYGWPNQAEGYHLRTDTGDTYSILARRGRKLWVFEVNDEGRIISGQTINAVNAKRIRNEEETKFTKDGGIILTTREDTTGSQKKYSYLVKLSSQGTLEWRSRIRNHFGLSLQETNDGCFVMTGYTFPSLSDRDIWTKKVDDEGQTVWEHTLGYESGKYGKYIQSTSDGGYVIVGCRNYR
jgi:hypothetical protein